MKTSFPDRRVAAMIMAGATGVAGVVAAALPASAAVAASKAAAPILDVRAPAAIGLDGEPVIMPATFRAPGTANWRARLNLDIDVVERTMNHSAYQFDLAARLPGATEWTRLDISQDTKGDLHAHSSEFTMASGVDVGFEIKFGYHSRAGDGSPPDIKAFNVKSSVEHAATGTIQASDRDNIIAQEPHVWFAKTPAQIKPGGAPAAVSLGVHNRTDSAYQRLLPTFELGRAGLTEENTKLEMRSPATGRWVPVPLRLAGAMGDQLLADFTEAHTFAVRPRAAVQVELRITVSGGVSGGSVRATAGAKNPDTGAFDLSTDVIDIPIG